MMMHSQRASRRLLIRISWLLSLALVGTFLLVLWSFSNVPSFQTMEAALSSQSKQPSCPDYGCPHYPIEIEANQTSDPKNVGRRHPSNSKVVASVSRRGNQHPINQDRAVIVHPFVVREHNAFLVALFDGHGVEGHFVADYCARHFPHELAETLRVHPHDIPQALHDAFLQINADIPEYYALRGGTTASVTLRMMDPHKMYVANVGDSLTMVMANKTILYQSRRDKPHLPDEQARIKARGGNIHIPPTFPNGSRVVVYSNTSKEHIGLAMSRSLGDWEWKPFGVIAEPIIDSIEIGDNDYWVMAVSDGVMDMRRPLYFAERLWNVNGSLDEECSQTIMDISPAKPEWYRDDMTICIVKM